jgi:hypothetical protein
MVDEQGEPMGPAGMAEADMAAAQHELDSGKVHGDISAALAQEATTLRELGWDEASGKVGDAAAHESAVQMQHQAVADAYTDAAHEWREADREYQEAGRLTGEARVGHDRERTAGDKLQHPDLSDEQRTALELEQAREHASEPVLEHRAEEVGAEADHHASKASNIEHFAREYEDIAKKQGSY